MFRKLMLCALAMLVMLPATANTQRASPMVVDLAPVGRNSVGRIDVTNPGSTDFPVEINMFRGEISEVGELTLIPADDDFLVFPAQVIVHAGEQQVVRVQYLGTGELTTSEIYYAAIRQVPVAFNPGESQLQLVVNFNILVNVVPEASRAEPVVDWVRPVTRDGVTGLEVLIGNVGTRYFTAGGVAWEVTGYAMDGTEVSFSRSAEEMARGIGVGVVAPGQKRLFFIPTETLLQDGTVQATLVL